MINCATLATLPSPGKALHENFKRSFEIYHCIQRNPHLPKYILKGISLPVCPWEAIKNETFLTILYTFPQHSDHHIIRNKFSLVHVSRGFLPELRPLFDCFSQHISRRKVRNTVFLFKHLCQRSLAYTGGSQQYQSNAAHAASPFS